MCDQSRYVGNCLLRSMDSAVRNRLLEKSEIVSLPAEQVIYEPGRHLTHVYFPIDLVASLLYTTRSGSTSEVAIVGNDGMLGVSVCLGGDCTPTYAVVLNAGSAYRVRVQLVRDELMRCESLQTLLLRYVQTLMTQASMMAACNRHHSIDQQLRRLLLMSMDRLGSGELFMTHELIANCLGVRREGITEAARHLQSAGIIAYHRGRIHILDRSRLETTCCECYSVVKREAEFLFPLPQAA